MQLEAADWADRLYEVSSAFAGPDPDRVAKRERLEELLSGNNDAPEEASNVVEIMAFVSRVNRDMSD